MCDPPYGIREGCRSTRPIDSPKDSSQGTSSMINANDGSDATVGAAGKRRLAIVDAMDELLAFAASSLVPGGRLVYWLPTVTDEYHPCDRPRHPQLAVAYDAGQRLSGKLSRRLITMVKLPCMARNIHCDTSQSKPQVIAEAAKDKIDRTRLGHHNLSAKVFGQAGRREDHLLRGLTAQAAAMKRPRETSPDETSISRSEMEM
eukprot:SAG31_NODE_4294_length_3375_cov_2.010989_4_plen_203_part_00